MSAIEIVITKLKATGAVTTLIPKASIYPIMWPETAQPPAVVVNVAGDSDVQMLTGAGGYYDTRVRVEALATTGTAALAIGKAILTALESVVKATIGGFHDVDIIYNGQFTDWADDRSMCRHSSDFSVRWRA
jgi:hypothetical protein